MSSAEEVYSTTYLKYKNLEDMLKVILFASQSPIGMVPMLYHINFKDKEVLFIETGAVNTVIHYMVLTEKPAKKFIELKQLTGKFEFVNGIGNDTQAIYIPILELEQSSFNFPV
ncbi:MAG: hypothetical protein QOK71_00235 [Nitrososphaeraceae archaeon]|jgi:hypothetical protein|nr:hypothetical protein [Nitrososphaeraceae archaeon]HJY10060.1 hypothetical protein [Nitrososphaeraceae archaeon]